MSIRGPIIVPPGISCGQQSVWRACLTYPYVIARTFLPLDVQSVQLHTSQLMVRPLSDPRTGLSPMSQHISVLCTHFLPYASSNCAHAFCCRRLTFGSDAKPQAARKVTERRQLCPKITRGAFISNPICLLIVGAARTRQLDQSGQSAVTGPNSSCHALPLSCASRRPSGVAAEGSTMQEAAHAEGQDVPIRRN